MENLIEKIDEYLKSSGKEDKACAEGLKIAKAIISQQSTKIEEQSMINLRTVKIRKLVKYISNDNQIYRDTGKTGKFHQWIVDGNSKDICGLIEMDDGTMEVFKYYQIVFEKDEDVTSVLSEEASKIFMRMIGSIEMQIEQGETPRDATFLTLSSFLLRQVNLDKTFNDKDLFNAIEAVIADVNNRFGVFQ